MSDRSSAGVFSSVFEILMDHMGNGPLPDTVVQNIAKRVAEATKEYDFTPGDLEAPDWGLCDLEEKLGLNFDIDCEEEEM